MATSIYIDCNRQNSIKSDSNPNEWEYKYSDEGLVLPVGTQVSIVDTFINKKGISGNSISIEETITETIQMCYYHSDNQMLEPDGSPAAASTGEGWKQIFAQGRTQSVNNTGLFMRRTNSGKKPLNDQSTYNIGGGFNHGYTENPMFACRIRQDGQTDTIGTLEPIIKHIKITIPRGTYSIVEIGKLIDDQLNGNLVEVDEENYDLDFLKRKKDAGFFFGTLDNGTTQHLVKALDVNTTTNGNKDYLGASPYSRFPSANWTVPPANTGLFCPAIKFRKLIEAWKKPETDAYPEKVPRNPFSWLYQTIQLNAAPDFYYNLNPDTGEQEVIDYFPLLVKREFSTVGRGAGGGFEPPADRTMYDLNSRGYYIGSADIKFQWDTERSAYTIGGLHQQYRLSSHDQYLNENSEQGEKAVLLRRLTDEANTGTLSESVKSSLRNPIERFGGLCIFNWAYDTCLKYGDVNHNDATKYRQTTKNMWTYDQFFESDKRAREVWRKTLWYRLGFRYDDLQNDKSWEKNKFYDNTAENDSKNYGRTTRAQIGIDAAPTISTTHYIKTYGDKKEIRTYGQLDIATPLTNYNTAGTLTGCTPSTYNNAGMFTGSLFQRSTTATILTDGRPIAAHSLPSLNTQGYFLVTSDIVDGIQDSVKKGKNLALLGVVPISNLASQDFITTRNVLVHSLAQEKILNSIKIKILNPDLTAPDLDDFSSVILRIEIPLEKNDKRQADTEGQPERKNKKELGSTVKDKRQPYLNSVKI